MHILSDEGFSLSKPKTEQDKPNQSNLVTFLLIIIMIGLFVLLIDEYDKKPLQADVYIQAGHEGRRVGNTGAVSSYGREVDWTIRVADEATRILRQAGVSVIRAPADQKRESVVRLALSIHFDGARRACSTGASIGLNNPSDKSAARAWKRIYREVFPFKWMPDNFSKNLKYYYNYRYTSTSDAELVLELGEMSCPEQARWMKSRLKKLGALVAYFAAQRIGASGVERPVF
ncbi:MAG: N-acetylmuramoyl-L-alanine amidase [Cocleimonas sp.]|nr:N-acetylmuramoyl-L-alanine amidase [Cocleimonas sp.]